MFAATDYVCNCEDKTKPCCCVFPILTPTGGLGGLRRIGSGMGLGAYPTDSFYDPNRPSWLPYWIDDLTESEAKYSGTGLLGAAQAVGSSAGDILGSVVGGAVGGAASSIGTSTLSTSSILGIGLLAAAAYFALKVVRG